MIDTEIPTTYDAALKVATKTVDELNKEHGPRTITMLGDKATVQTSVIPTGLLALDYGVLGVGGMPRGRLIEIYGPESSGKTTLALHIIAMAQKEKKIAAFIDVEHALDKVWAEINGVDTDNLFLSQPDYGEQALQIVETLVDSKSFGIIVVDSVAALIPKAELEGDMGDSVMGVQARLMSQACRKLTGIVAKSNTCLIFINQVRDKIGIVYGNPEVTTGGRALKFYSSVRLEIRKSTALKDGDEIIGNLTKIKAVKNKVAPPFRETEVNLLYGSGFDVYDNNLQFAAACGIVEKSGAWYSFNSERLGQGRAQAVKCLRDNKHIYDEMVSRCIKL